MQFLKNVMYIYFLYFLLVLIVHYVKDLDFFSTVVNFSKVSSRTL